MKLMVFYLEGDKLKVLQNGLIIVLIKVIDKVNVDVFFVELKVWIGG